MSQFIEINTNEFINLDKINHIKIVELPYIRVEFYNSMGSYAPEWQDKLDCFTSLKHDMLAFSKPFKTVEEARKWSVNICTVIYRY